MGSNPAAPTILPTRSRPPENDIIVRTRVSPNTLIPKVFVLQIDKDPILAFEANSLHEARELAKEQWLLAELGGLRSGGSPVWDGHGAIQIGPAIGDHVEDVRAQLSSLRDSVDLPIVYLIQIDR